MKSMVNKVSSNGAHKESYGKSVLMVWRKFSMSCNQSVLTDKSWKRRLLTKKTHICTCICNGITSQREWGQKIQVDFKYAVSQCHIWNRNSIISMTVWYVYTSKYTGGSKEGAQDYNVHQTKSNCSLSSKLTILFSFFTMPNCQGSGKGGEGSHLHLMGFVLK